MEPSPQTAPDRPASAAKGGSGRDIVAWRATSTGRNVALVSIDLIPGRPLRLWGAAVEAADGGVHPPRHSRPLRRLEHQPASGRGAGPVRGGAGAFRRGGPGRDRAPFGSRRRRAPRAAGWLGGAAGLFCTGAAGESGFAVSMEPGQGGAILDRQRALKALNLQARPCLRPCRPTRTGVGLRRLSLAGEHLHGRAGASAPPAPEMETISTWPST